MTSERDLRHPPIESAYGIRVGDVIEQYGIPGTVVEMRTGYATGSGVRAIVEWDQTANATSRVQILQTRTLKDPINIDEDDILKRAPGYRADELPDGVEAQDPRPTEILDSLKWEFRKQRETMQRQMIALDQRMIGLELELKAQKRIVWKLMDGRERREAKEDG